MDLPHSAEHRPVLMCPAPSSSLQECPELETQPWFAELVMFGAGPDPSAETEDSLREDPDCLLVSRVLERAVLPKITGRYRA